MSSQKNRGYLCLVLHAHLPYVRHPEHEYFLEENWLYEAITETYIPLFEVFSRLLDDGVDFRITMSFSPPLIEMFNDGLLMERYVGHLERLIELAEREVLRTKKDIRFGPVARMYRNRLLRIRHLFVEVWKKDLVSTLRGLQDSGNVELITTAATHAFLPNLSIYSEAVRAQVRIGLENHRKVFGRSPKGIWLPECGYVPGFDSLLKEEGVGFVFLDAHGITNGRPTPRYGVYAPVISPAGVSAFGRDAETSQQVWSAIGGYPGDYYYREFYRDIGFDIDLDHVKAFLGPYGTKTFTGLKYYRITGRTDIKKPYILKRAMDKTVDHASDFVMKREIQVNRLRDALGIAPVITAAYDAELFGHWWFEGPQWLEALLRKIPSASSNFKTITPGGYLSEHSEGAHPAHPERLQACEPSMSSWGENGYSEVWLNDSNDYVIRHVLKATERMIYLSRRFPCAEGLLLRALNQAVRELLLAQHSDWAFIMKSNTAAGYAKRRFAEHIGRFSFLYKSIISGDIPETRLTEMEEKDKIFQDVDYRVYNMCK